MFTKIRKIKPAVIARNKAAGVMKAATAAVKAADKPTMAIAMGLTVLPIPIVGTVSRAMLGSIAFTRDITPFECGDIKEYTFKTGINIVKSVGGVMLATLMPPIISMPVAFIGAIKLGIMAKRLKEFYATAKA